MTRDRDTPTLTLPQGGGNIWETACLILNQIKENVRSQRLASLEEEAVLGIGELGLAQAVVRDHRRLGREGRRQPAAHAADEPTARGSRSASRP